MKLSELLKNNPEVNSSPVPATPQVNRPRISPAPAKSPQTPSVEDIENKVRTGVEREFQEKMRQMEADLKRLTEEQLLSQQRLVESREQALESEKKRLADELRNLKSANENLSSAQSQKEEEWKKRLDDERERFRKELQNQVQESVQKRTEELQKEILSKEKAALEKQNRDEELLKEKISQVPLPEVRRSEAAPEIKPPVAEFKVPEITRKPAAASAPVGDIFILDAKTEEKLRKLYQVLAQAGEAIFEKLLRSGTLEADYLNKLLGEVYDLMEKNGEDFLTIVLEPYPSSDYFSYHSANCSILSIMIGQELKMSEDDVKQLALASFLHDVGLLGIRENLDYPKPLTPELKTEILKHPERGAALLGDSVSQNIQTAIIQHHETMNGKGYPKGLTDSEIHSFAKIMQVVDAFEAMIHHRPYRQKPLEVSEALREMVDRGRGVYDRDAMKALMSRIGLYPVLSLVELSNHKIARVMRQSRKFPLSPIVRIEFDEDGNKLKTPVLIDLSKNQLIHIHASVGSADSYGKERLEKQAKEEPRKSFRLWEFIPFLFVVVVLAVVAYLVLKL